MISFLLLTLGFAYSSFSSCLGVGLGCLRFFLFPEVILYWTSPNMFSNILFSLHVFVIFSFLLMCMLSHFSHVWLFATLWTIAHQAPLSMVFSRQEYWSGLPWSISNLILLWLEMKLDVVSIFLNLPRLVLWPSMWFILENVPCAPDKHVYSAVFRRNPL